MNILITGGNGYIASALRCVLQNKHDVTSVGRKDFCLVDCNATCEWFKDRQFDVVIHTAVVGGSRLFQDDTIALDTNTKMYDSLLINKHHFGKLISFGSGAEIFQPNTPYGMSKLRLAESIRTTENFYNLRIFAVFDENELSTRFIKSNILCYNNKEPMSIHKNKIMDFFYMRDLVSLVDYYITAENPPKKTHCCYEEKYTLKNIANMINSLNTHKVPIIVDDMNELEFYCGDFNLPPINLVGLRQGIKNVFKCLF